MSTFASQSKKTAALADIIRSANIPGIQIVWSKGGRTEALNLGVIDDGSTVKVTDGSIFEAASLSKAVVAYATLRLVDRGVLDLDEPLLAYVGHVDRFDPANPDYGKITARMVLSHRAGFPNWAGPERLPLWFHPGTHFNYSGEGYVFLLTALERLTHKDLNQIANEEVFDPLKMRSSSFKWRADFASLSTFGSGSDAVTNHSELNPASSLLTTAHDFGIFLAALISGKGLNPNTYQLMFEWTDAAKWFRHPEVAATPHIGWGLGVGLQRNEKGEAIWQWGDNGDFKACYIAFPKSRERLVYFTHSSRGLYIAQAVIDLFLGKQTTWAIPWVRNGYPHNPYEIGYDNPYAVETLWRKLLKVGYAAAPTVYGECRTKDSRFVISEGDLNSFGDILIDSGEEQNALEVFKLNAANHPSSAAVHQSLGFAYDKIGNRELAIQTLTTCVALDPTRTEAAEHLEKLMMSAAAKQN